MVKLQRKSREDGWGIWNVVFNKMIREDIIEKMVFEQKFKRGKGKLLIPYFWERLLSKGPVSDVSLSEVFTNCYNSMCLMSTGGTLLFSCRVCSQILVFLLKHMSSFTCEF